MLFNQMKNIYKISVRFFFTFLVCGLLFVANAFPAQAATSSPTKGEESLNEVQQKTDEVAKSNPRGMEETTERAKGGINAVQGEADKEKMVSPEEAKDAETAEEQTKGFLEKILD